MPCPLWRNIGSEVNILPNVPIGKKPLRTHRAISLPRSIEIRPSRLRTTQIGGPIIYLWNFVLTLGIMGDVAKHTWSTARRAMPNRQISQVLQGHKLVSATPSLTVREAVVSMADHNVGALVILDASKRLVGIFTERDLLIRVVAKGLNPDAVALDEVMTRNPVTVSITDKVRIAMAEMYENKLRHLPVLDHGEVVGILSMRDFVGTEIQELEQVAEFEERIWETTG